MLRFDDRELSIKRLAQGLFIAFIAAFGWIVVGMFKGRGPFETLMLDADVLIYTAIFAVLTFAIFARETDVEHAKAEEQRRRLDALVVTDPMTSLKNVRYFRARLYEEYARSLRTRQPLALAIIDLDHFKRVNDEYGHQAGDAVLVAAASAIASTVRRGETVARVGGEEFALLLPGSDTEAAENAGERVRKAIERTVFPRPDSPSDRLDLTASVGIASTDCIGFKGPEVLYGAADEALLRAKRDGRNMVQVNKRPSTAPPLRLLA